MPKIRTHTHLYKLPITSNPRRFIRCNFISFDFSVFRRIHGLVFSLSRGLYNPNRWQFQMLLNMWKSACTKFYRQITELKAHKKKI
uniref:Uncharacterized protein n=1 Tax=Cucumis sativus TaxID=3659 RepID=A0A0A0LZB8_CUCSA